MSAKKLSSHDFGIDISVKHEKESDSAPKQRVFVITVTEPWLRKLLTKCDFAEARGEYIDLKFLVKKLFALTEERDSDQ